MRKKVGFTLIELLVVVAIIAVLVAILLPTLQRVRMRTRTVICQSNLRQVATGIYQYALDYNDYMINLRLSCPRPNYPDYYSRWDDWLRAHYLNGEGGDGGYSPGEVTTCPEIDRDMANLGGSQTAGYGLNINSSGTPFYPEYHKEWWRFSEVVLPTSKAVYITDTSSIDSWMVNWNLHTTFRAQMNSWPSIPARRHDNTFNVVFIDFHIETAHWPEEISDNGHLWNLFGWYGWDP